MFKTIIPIKLSDSYVSDKVSDNGSRELLIAHLTGNGDISASEAAQLIGSSAKTARRLLLRLAEEGIVSVTGANRNRRYKLEHREQINY